MFSWDEAKNEHNQRKHGISFEAATLVFEDPMHITRQDRIENGEQRWQTVQSLLLIAHTWREAGNGTEHIRLISARRATKLERKIHEQST